MIRIACRCKNTLDLPDDQAGLTAQCPRCGNLLDVPLLSDLHSLERDGTYKLDSPTLEQSKLDELTEVYYPGRVHKDGREIDLRGPVEAPEIVPLAGDEEEAPPRDRPKYDPESGELVQPLGLEKPIKPASSAQLPEARRVIDYNVSAGALEGAPHGLGVFVALFSPLNVVVMAIIFLLHLLLVMGIVVIGVVVGVTVGAVQAQ